MKSKIIILISLLATLALVMLLGMQLYWVNTAANIKEQNFEHNVADAISNVIYKLDKIETVKVLNKRSKTFSKDSLFLSSLDSVKRFFAKYYLSPIDSLKESEKFDKLLKKSYVLNNVLQKIIEYNHFQLLENKVKIKELDSLISIELKNKNIRIKYEFEIYSPQKHMMLLQKTGKYTAELLNNSYKYNLFPEDIYLPSEYLYIYFPKRTTYIFTHMWGILLISGVLVGILVYIFTYTIFILVRQKKLADLKTDLLNNLTHEFKTPISTISLACEALGDKDLQRSSELFNNYVEVIKEENKRLGLMAENVLLAAIIEKGNLRLNRNPLSLHNLILNVIKNISLQVNSRNGLIVSELKAYNDVVNGDREHLSSVIYNLIDNAIKYSSNNPNIKVSTQNIEDGIIISVADNGIGINRINQKKIFENLYRVPTGNIHDAKGYGLGLSYVKAIVEKHGGSISVESQIKKGSTFNIMLPFY